MHLRTRGQNANPNVPRQGLCLERLSVLRKDGHECLYLHGVSVPVLGGEGVHRDDLHSSLHAPLDAVHQRLAPRPVALEEIM